MAEASNAGSVPHGPYPHKDLRRILGSVRILWRDERLVVVDKPSGLLVHRGWAREPVVAMSLVRDLVGRFVYPVHRLDRGASGALLMALDAETAAALSALFEAGAVGKRYLALVRGVAPEAGRIDHPIPRREDGPRVPAVTVFRRLAVCDGYSVVEAAPETGRLHQVRRHLKHIAHPIIGDATYGKGAHNRLLRERFGLARLALHASCLRFVHPWTGAEICARAPLPADLAGPLARMGLHIDQ